MITILVSVRSVCAVSRSVVRGNVLSTNPKRNLALNSVRAQQTFVAKVTVCRHAVYQQTFDSGLDHRSVLIIHRAITHTSSMFFQHSASLTIIISKTTTPTPTTTTTTHTHTPLQLLPAPSSHTHTTHTPHLRLDFLQSGQRSPEEMKHEFCLGCHRKTGS